MDHSKSYDTPSEVTAEQGQVLVDGPDGVAVSFTPDAAIETGDRLIDGGIKARGQQIDAERRARPLTAPLPIDPQR